MKGSERGAFCGFAMKLSSSDSLFKAEIELRKYVISHEMAHLQRCDYSISVVF